jgi:hypothetical protein
MRWLVSLKPQTAPFSVFVTKLLGILELKVANEPSRIAMEAHAAKSVSPSLGHADSREIIGSRTIDQGRIFLPKAVRHILKWLKLH